MSAPNNDAIRAALQTIADAIAACVALLPEDAPQNIRDGLGGMQSTMDAVNAQAQTWFSNQ